MAILSADQFPGANQNPLDYPGFRPSFSFVYFQGKVHEVKVQGSTPKDLCVDTEAGPEKINTFLQARGNAPIEERHAVLAVGSNGCPGRLAEKYGVESDVCIPVLFGSLSDTAIVYSRTLVSYGALPATYLSQPGMSSRLSVTLLTDEQFCQMDNTENIGSTYYRIPVPGRFQLQKGFTLENLSAYMDPRVLTYQQKPVLLKMFALKESFWPAMDEREVLSLMFDEAELLMGESIEKRHQRLLHEASVRASLSQFLKSNMGDICLDDCGRLPS